MKYPEKLCYDRPSYSNYEFYFWSSWDGFWGVGDYLGNALRFIRRTNEYFISNVCMLYENEDDYRDKMLTYYLRKNI